MRSNLHTRVLDQEPLAQAYTAEVKISAPLRPCSFCFKKCFESLMQDISPHSCTTILNKYTAKELQNHGTSSKLKSTSQNQSLN